MRMEAVTVVFDVVRGYLQVAGGLTDVSLQRARDLADTLLSTSGEAAERGSEQFSALAEDLVKQSQTNREILLGLIRTEIDRTVGRMGFVREEELAAVRNHVQRLEAQVKVLQSGAAGAGSAARSAGGAAVRTISGAADKAAKAVPVKRSEEPAKAEPVAAEATPAETSPASTAPVEKAPARKPAAKKAPARKAPAKKAPARKAPAKKAPAPKPAADDV